MEILIFLILTCFIFLILNYFLRLPIEIYILIVAIGFVFSQLVLQTKDINTKSLSEKGYNSYLSKASAIGTKRSLDNNSQKQKQSYNMDTFRIKPLPGRDYKINHGGKVVIAVASKKQGNTRYNQCGWYGCRVLDSNIGIFRHGGKDKDMPNSVMTIKNYNLALYSSKKNAPIKYGEIIALDTIDSVTKQQLPLLKILRPPPHNNNRTGTVHPNHTVMFVDAKYEEKIYVMLNNRLGTMIDIVPGMKPDNLNNNRNNELSII